MPAAAQPSEIARAPLDLGVFENEIDGGLAERLAIGLVILATDQTLEYEFRELIRIPGVAFYEARVLNDNDITPETLRAIGPRIAPTLDLILPGVKLDVAGFGCTSATMTLGEEAVFAELRKARPGIACTTPVTAAFAAFRALGARRIGLLTPYSRRINQNLARYFEDHDVEVAAMATFERQDDREAARISLASIEAGAKRLAKAPGVECVFVSCTSLRVANIVACVEGATGVPVTSSNHAMAWHCLRLGGVKDRVPGAGRLFELDLA
jgi:maleate isomerase